MFLTNRLYLRQRLCVLACLLLAALATTPARAELDTAALSARLTAIAAQPGLGTLAIAVRDLHSNKTVLLRAGERLPQQSVYKLAIALAAVARADRGDVDLDQPITLTRASISPMWSPISAEIGAEGLTLPLRDLLRRMVALSDNTACDAVLDHLGGPKVVQAELDALSLHAVRVDRPERELVANVLGLGDWQARWREPAVLEAAVAALHPQQRIAALTAYFDDPRDSASAAGLLDLLTRLEKGELLSAAGTAQLLDWLEQTATGAARLRAGLPADWRLAHKTGTGPVVESIASASNDAGIAYAPDGGRIAIVVLMRGAVAPSQQRDAAIAAVAAAVVAAYR